jgi:hypothetical protein
MNNYVSPVIFDNDELAEGVYASGSGAGDCWTMTYGVAQRETSNPTEKFVVYRINATHHTDGVFHISKSTTMFVTYHGNGITGVEVEGVKVLANTGIVEVVKGMDGFKVGCTESGATIVRHYLGDAYQSGDNFNIMIRIDCADGEAVVDGLTWSCEKIENVQGTASEAGEDVGEYVQQS